MGYGVGGGQPPGPPSRPHRAVVGREGDTVWRDASAGLPAALQGLPESLPQVAQPRAVVALQLLQAPLGAADGAKSGRQRLYLWGGSEGSACPSSPLPCPQIPSPQPQGVTSQKALQGSQRPVHAAPDARDDHAAQEGPDVCGDGGLSAGPPGSSRTWLHRAGARAPQRPPQHLKSPRTSPKSRLWVQEAAPAPPAHALTLQAAVGAVQRHVAAVDDKIHLLQGERRGVSTGWGAPWGPFPTSSPTATLSGVGGVPLGMPGGWRPGRCRGCPPWC